MSYAFAADPARAQAPALSAEVGHPRRVFSLTVSPLHLTLPVLELTGEARVLDKLGVALIAGAGKIGQAATATTPKISATALEAGLQARYYLLGDFRHGMQIGAEALYVHASDEIETTSASAKGLAVGPFVGYKYTADIGFTFDGQLASSAWALPARPTTARTAQSPRTRATSCC